MTHAQKNAVEDLIVEFNPREVHHGDCIGADEDFYNIVLALSNAIVIAHPPDDPRKRAFTKVDVFRPEKKYLRRNKDIVAESDVLIATPKQFDEPSYYSRSKGGTWATVGYARKAGIPIYKVFPDGEIELEDDND
jgi:hypothetical protein